MNDERDIRTPRRPPAMRLTFDRPGPETALVRVFERGEPLPRYIEAAFQPDRPTARLVGTPSAWFNEPAPGETLVARIPSSEFEDAPGRTRNVTIREEDETRLRTMAMNSSLSAANNGSRASGNAVVTIPIRIRRPG